MDCLIFYASSSSWLILTKYWASTWRKAFMLINYIKFYYSLLKYSTNTILIKSKMHYFISSLCRSHQICHYTSISSSLLKSYLPILHGLRAFWSPKRLDPLLSMFLFEHGLAKWKSQTISSSMNTLKCKAAPKAFSYKKRKLIFFMRLEYFIGW